MTLRNSVIFIRVCMGIERSYKIVQNRGKRSNLPSHLLSITCVSMSFRGVSKRFQWVFGSLFSSPYIDGEENREPKTHWNRFETPPNAIETQVILRRWEGKSILLDLFPLF